jgi:hypothetical protein
MLEEIGAEEMVLKPLEPERSNEYCFLCEYGFSSGTQAKQLIAQVRSIIDESIGRRALSDICDDVVEFYNENVREFVEDHPVWTRKSVEEHLLRTETNLDIAMELDKRSVTQIMQWLREHMLESTTGDLHMPNVSTYLKFSQHLQKLCGQKPATVR